MSRSILLAAVCWLLSFYVRAQSSSMIMGAKANAMGYASGCIGDVWSLFGNVGGLAEIKRPVASFSQHFTPSFKSFNRVSVVFATPLRYGVVGAGAFRFGDELYNEQVLSLAFSNTFGLSSLGLKMSYIRYRSDGFGSKGALGFSFGGIAKLTPQIRVGTYITNLTQPIISSIDNERLPTKVIASVGFIPGEKLIIVIEAEQDLSNSTLWKTGIDYKVNPKMSVRTGFNLNPEAAFFGLGFNTHKFILDYSFQFQEYLGASHQATVSYHFKSRKK